MFQLPIEYNDSKIIEFNVVLRELLINAIVHGNECIVERTVKCSIERMGEKRFKVVVKDQGKGFNYRNINIDLPKNSALIENRGYALINKLSDRIEFNNSGNCVTAYITMADH